MARQDPQNEPGGNRRTGAWLDSLPLFEGLSPTDRDAVRSAVRRRELPAGATLFQRGDAGEGLMVVVRGLVRLSLDSSNGRSLTIRLVGPGEIFGEIALIDGAGRTTDAVAIALTTLDVLTHRDFKRLFAVSPRLQENTLAMLCARLRTTTAQLEAAALLPLEARLARILRAFCEQAGARQPDGRVSFELAVTQSDLAALAGASRPKVNAVLVGFEQSRVAVRSGKRFSCDAAALDELAAGATET